MNAIETNAKQAANEEQEVLVGEEAVYEEAVAGGGATKTQTANKIERKSIFEKWSDKLKDFLDNAE